MMWICVSRNKNEFRALFYSYELGKRRIYRSSYPVPKDKTFRLFEYKRKEKAQLMCDEINEVYSDNFEHMEVNESVINDVKEYAKNGFIIGVDLSNGKDYQCMPSADNEKGVNDV